MKNIKLLSFTSAGLLFASISFNLSAQEWAPVGAQWHYSIPGFIFASYETITSVKDTLILERNCRKLQIRSGMPEYEAVYSKYMYQENDQVYRYYPDENRFGLIYDFSKEAGNSWMLDLGSYLVTVNVDSTSWIQINDSIRKVQYVNDGGFAHFWGPIIEGIGHMQYLFPINGLAGPAYGPFRCYQDSTVGLFKFSWLDQGLLPCDTTWNLSMNTHVSQNDLSFAPKISPNPAHDHLFISLDVGTQPFEALSLLDLQGRPVRQEAYAAPTYEGELSLHGIPPGLYLLKVVSRDGTWGVRKVLVR